MKKFTVFADYVATVIVGEIEADSAEEAVAKLADNAESSIPFVATAKNTL